MVDKNKKISELLGIWVPPPKGQKNHSIIQNFTTPSGRIALLKLMSIRDDYVEFIDSLSHFNFTATFIRNFLFTTDNLIDAAISFITNKNKEKEKEKLWKEKSMKR